jgi:signal transduction histidine kinase
VNADDQSFPASPGLRLRPNTRNLSFRYAALSLTDPDRVQFRYKLEGYDGDWRGTVNAREATYTNLPPGAYRFRVIASNNDGVWNQEGASVEFRITPAFYQTTWFLLLGAGLAMILAWTIYKARVRNMTARLDQQFRGRLLERTRIAQDLHDTLLQGFLSASIQLHVVDDQLPGDSPAKPRLSRVLQLMANVSEEARNTLRGLRSSEQGGSLDLEEAFSRIRQELAIPDDVAFRVVVEGRPRPLRPIARDEVYRIGREALVNAFRHARANHIEVEVEYVAKQLRVIVRDDGRGIDSDVLRAGREDHFGLLGMRERAERIGSKLRVMSRDGLGTEIELSVPATVAFQAPTAGRPTRWFDAWFRPSAAADGTESGKQGQP